MPLPTDAEALEAQITELAAHIHAATYRLLTLVAELDRREIWADHGCRSCAHWLNWKCGIDLGAGREKVRVAKALPSLPRISAAFRDGRVSYSKVRAMTRVATPENESELLNIAVYGTAAQVEKLVRAYRKAREADELYAANVRHAKRALTWYYDDDGSVVFHCRLEPEDGARMIKALNCAFKALNDDLPEDVSAETSEADAIVHEPISARRADALVLIADTVMANGAVRPPPGERFEVTVHIDADTLTGENSRGRSETANGAALPAETVRRLGCDGALVGIVEDENGTPLNVGRRTRAIPPALRRALESRDHGCRFPGCAATRFVEGHHVKHWAHGGETRLDNLVTLCTYHHRLVHEGGFEVEAAAGEFHFFNRAGALIATTPAFPRKRLNGEAALMRQNRDSGLQIDASTGASRWGGETLGYDIALDGLFAADGVLQISPE